MSNNKRLKSMLKGWEVDAAYLMFRGFSDEEIANELWPYESVQMNTKKTRIQKLRKKEVFMEFYRTIVTDWSIHNVGRAYSKLSDQIDSDQPWLANKAANDIIALSKQVITGADDNTVVIKMEGMPELGSPDDNG